MPPDEEENKIETPPEDATGIATPPEETVSKADYLALQKKLEDEKAFSARMKAAEDEQRKKRQASGTEVEKLQAAVEALATQNAAFQTQIDIMKPTVEAQLAKVNEAKEAVAARIEKGDLPAYVSSLLPGQSPLTALAAIESFDATAQATAQSSNVTPDTPTVASTTTTPPPANPGNDVDFAHLMQTTGKGLPQLMAEYPEAWAAKVAQADVSVATGSNAFLGNIFSGSAGKTKGS